MPVLIATVVLRVFGLGMVWATILAIGSPGATALLAIPFGLLAAFFLLSEVTYSK